MFTSSLSSCESAMISVPPLSVHRVKAFRNLAVAYQFTSIIFPMSVRQLLKQYLCQTQVSAYKLVASPKCPKTNKYTRGIYSAFTCHRPCSPTRAAETCRNDERRQWLRYRHCADFQFWKPCGRVCFFNWFEYVVSLLCGPWTTAHTHGFGERGASTLNYWMFKRAMDLGS